MTKIIAIGALGGSGTRAIAQVLMDYGIYMGDYFNKSKDNLLFTRLFKHPDFHDQASPAMIGRRLDAFRAYMQTGHLSFSQARIIMNASRANPTVKRRFRFHARVLRKVFSPAIDRDTWGWKEPNTQIYLKEIDDQFENLKYIHVIRHGLDMAFSDNMMQLFSWGHKYGIPLGADMPEEEKSYKQLEYWIRSTQDVLKKSKQMRGDFLLINHSHFGAQPQQQVDRIMDFIEETPSPAQRQALYRIPRTPKTENRYRKHDLGIFDQRQIDFVKDMGFEVAGA